MRDELVDLRLIVEQYNAAHAVYHWLFSALWLPECLKALLLAWFCIVWAALRWVGVNLDSAERVAANPRLTAFWACLFGQHKLSRPLDLLQPKDRTLTAQALVLFNLKILLANTPQEECVQS